MEMSERRTESRDIKTEYLTALTSQIRCRKARPLVEEELTT